MTFHWKWTKIDGWKLTAAAAHARVWVSCRKILHNTISSFARARTPHHRRRHRAVEPNESEWSEERRRNLVKRKKIIHRMKEKWRRREKTLQLWLCFAFGFLRGFHTVFFAAALTFSRAWFHHRLARCGFYSSFICLQRVRCRCGRYIYNRKPTIEQKT